MKKIDCKTPSNYKSIQPSSNSACLSAKYLSWRVHSPLYLRFCCAESSQTGNEDTHESANVNATSTNATDTTNKEFNVVVFFRETM